MVHWDDPEGWYKEEGGRGIQDGEHVYIRGGYMLMYGKTNAKCKVINLQLNKFIKKIKEREEKGEGRDRDHKRARETDV